MPKRLARRVRALLRPWMDREVYECLTLPWRRATEVRPRTGGVYVQAGGAGRACPPARRPRVRHLGKVSARDRAAPGRVLRRLRRRRPRQLAFFAPASPTAIDEHLRFQFPPGWIYVYKALTLPAWRGRGLLPALLTQAMPHLGNSAALPTGFVTLVISGNDASFKAFNRCGFQNAQAFPVWRVLERPCGLAPRRATFSIGVACPETGTQVSSLTGCSSTPSRARECLP